MKEPKREFTTSTGKVIHLQPVANRLFTDTQAEVEQEFVKNGKPVEPPQYEVPTIDGSSQSYYFDQETIDQRTEKGTLTDEEKEAWAAHLECLKELATEQNERTIVVAIIEGVLDEPTDEWKARMKFYGIELPDDPYDLKARYVTYELLRTPEDKTTFSTAIMLLSAGMEVDQVAIEAAMASFRDSIRGAQGPLLESLAQTLARRREGDLDVQPGIPEGEGGGELGQVDNGIRADEQD